MGRDYFLKHFKKFIIFFGVFVMGFIYQNCGQKMASGNIEGDEQLLLTETNSLLYNPGPSYAAGLTLANVSAALTLPNVENEQIGFSQWGTSLEEAHRVGNEAQGCMKTLYMHDANLNAFPLMPSDNGACATFYTDTRVGWFAQDLNKTPGWSIWQLSGGHGQPLELRYLNHARGTTDPCKLREIGLIYQNWDFAPHSMFRRRLDGQQFRLGDFEKVRVKLKAKVDLFNSPTCSSYPTAKVVVDFRLVFKDSSNVLSKTYIVTVVLFGMEGVGIDGQPHSNPDEPIYFQGTQYVEGKPIEMIQYHSSKLGVIGFPRQKTLTDDYQKYDMDFKKLFPLYLASNPTLPPGQTLNDAIIDGLDIYTSTQGGDLDFTVSEVNMIGDPPTPPSS